MTSDPDHKSTASEEQSPTEEAPTLAEREAFKPSGETKDGGALTKKGKKAKKDKPEPTTFAGKLWYGWVKPIGSVIIVVIVVRSMLIDWNDVPSGSMEPEIHVGDRVAVNRLAYALQFPLTGPKIGIPFIGPQFDNPLDGIPQIQWGTPKRGDIVTFWNPVSKIRMIKRIVAVAGDTIEVRNSVMIINGSAATYQHIDALAQGLAVQTKYYVPGPLGAKTLEMKELIYRQETLLDQVRLTQHIQVNWPDRQHIIETPDGQLLFAYKGIVAMPTGTGGVQQLPLEDYFLRFPRSRLIAQLKEGQILMSGKEASYEQFAKALLKRYQTGPVADTLKKIGLGVQGADLVIDGEPAFIERFRVAFDERVARLTESERRSLAEFQNVFVRTLRNTLGTNFGPYTIPDGKCFMVGDNRNNSSDGRFFGPVDLGEITGKAFGVAFSFKDNKMLALPPDPAWDRFFKDLD